MASRVSTPKHARKMIEDIKEMIAGKHSDEDIYAVLTECSFDPNETVQRLLYLDTFHEVKKKRDRRKENVDSRALGNYKWASTMQGRGARGGRGNYSSYYSDATGGRNTAFHKENGVNYNSARLLVSQKAGNEAAYGMTKSSAIAENVPKKEANGMYTHGRVIQACAVGPTKSLPNDNLPIDGNKLEALPPSTSVPVKLKTDLESTEAASGSEVAAVEGKVLSICNHLPSIMTPASSSGVYSSASDPVLVLSLNSRPTGLMGAIKREVGSQKVSFETVPPVLAEGDHTKVDTHVEQNVDDSTLLSSVINVSVAGNANNANHDMPAQSKDVDNSQLSASKYNCEPADNLIGSMEVITSENGCVTVEANSQSPHDLGISSLEEASSKLCITSGRHVIFPNDFHVNEALKNGLTFGSFDGSFGTDTKSFNDVVGEKPLLPEEKPLLPEEKPEADLSEKNDEIAKESSLSNQTTYSISEETGCPDHQSPTNVSENSSSLESNVSSDAVPHFDKTKPERLLPTGGPQFPVVQTASNYNFGFLPPMLGSQLLQFERPDTQARDASRAANFAQHGDSLCISSSSTTPGAQSAGALTTPLALPPQSLPVFRQPYPPNYLPYSHYFSPYFVPPVHQFLSHTGFTQQLPSANVYLPASAGATGIKFNLPQYKPGTNAGSLAHIGIPSGYGSYGSTVAYNPMAAVTSSSAGNEGIAAPHLKENSMHAGGLQTEGSAAWIPMPGRDMPHLQTNSFYNLSPQGQHLAFSPAQAAHGGTFAGIYHPSQTMSAPSAIHSLLHHSQAVAAGSVESVGPPPPSVSYQQQPHATHMNWNASY